MKILIIGTGAVGSYYGAKLAAAGADVSVLARSDYDAVRAKGIDIESDEGALHFRPRQVVRAASEYEGRPDYVIVCLKVLPHIDAAGIIRDAVGPETSIALLQNGIEIEKPLADAFPDNEIISIVAFTCLNRIAPGRIRHTGFGRLALGSYPGGLSESGRKLADLLNEAGVPCATTETIETTRWQKLVWNCPFNPISALADGSATDAILAVPETERFVRGVMAEVVQAAKAAGHELPPDIIEKNISSTLTMGAYKPSMMLDYEARRPMEVEAILGAPIRIARRFGVAVPYLESLHALLSLVDSKFE